MKFLKTMGMINNLAIWRGFLGPNSCAISSDGRIFVLDYYLYPEKTARITVQNFEEEFLFEFATLQGSNPGDKLLKIPSDLEFDSKDRLYVTDEGLNAVMVYDSSGNYFNKWGDIGQNEGQFNGPSGIAIDSKDHLFIVDQYNHRIQKFTNEGEFLNSWGVYGSQEGEFNLPWGICIDQNDNVFVADWRNDRIQKFTNEGEFLNLFGKTGTGNGELIRPSDVVVDSNGMIFISDWGNERVVVLDRYGTYICSESGQSQLTTKWTEEFFESNVDERHTRENSNLIPDLPDHLQAPYHKSSQTEPFFWGITDLTLDLQERLYVTEHRRHRIQIFGDLSNV